MAFISIVSSLIAALLLSQDGAAGVIVLAETGCFVLHRLCPYRPLLTFTVYFASYTARFI